MGSCCMFLAEPYAAGHKRWQSNTIGLGCGQQLQLFLFKSTRSISKTYQKDLTAE